MKSVIRKVTGKKKPFDIDGDGKVSMSDLAAIFTGYRHKEATSADFVKERAAEIWGNNEHHFMLLSARIQKRKTQAKSLLRKIFRGEKDNKIEKIVKTVLKSIDDIELLSFQDAYAKSVTTIINTEGKLAELNASTFMLNSQNEPKHRRAANKFEKNLKDQRSNQKETIEKFRKRMNLYGTDLDLDQAEVLLTRIDSADIVKLSTVFSIVQTLTKQLALAKTSSAENIEVTKKYYGAYIGLLEIQELVQTEYLDQIDAKYLPGINSIRLKTVELMDRTKSAVSSASSDHFSSYEANISSQEYTIEVTKKYEDILTGNRLKIENARSLVQELIALAENTLQTVKVSADLVNLIKRSETMFDQVIELQAPDLLPFESAELRREFENVTMKIRSAS
jgi:hypothetical protein